MNVHQHGLQHSIITHLRALTGLTVIWQYGGVKLPASTPFITVEQMQNNNAILTKQREAVQSIYRFQIGYFASSANDRARRQDVIKRSLIFDTIEYLDTDRSPAQADGFFRCELTAEEPFNAEGIEDISQYHRVYFDVEIDTVMRAKR
ncbi:hypothetical protein [Bacillus sp. FSL K6-3431]|uniref:hypothetical protein n=1 Tax=Bacillus sp. FSL K6-3431 TaxID=2921500 RepID=UPI0030F75BF8